MRHSSISQRFGDGRTATSEVTASGGRVESAQTESVARGRPYEEEIDWVRVGVFGLGVAVGAALGVGAALLFAPQSGAATRMALRRRSRLMGDRAADLWDDLGTELRLAARRGRRRARRVVRGARVRAAEKLEG